MNSLDQNQNQQSPNFDFILKQPGPGDAGPSKKRDKKIIVLIVLVVFTLVVLIIGAFLTSGDNVVEETAVVYEGPIVSAQEAEPVIKDFLAKIAEGDYDGAYTLVDDSEDNIFTKDALINEGLPILNTLKLTECTLAQEDTAKRLVVFGCSSKEGDLVVNLEFTMTKKGEQVKIVYYALGESA